MTCPESLPLSAPLIGQIVLGCTKAYGHGGRHESPPPSDLPLRWPASANPKITWGGAPRKREPKPKAPRMTVKDAATLGRAEGYL